MQLGLHYHSYSTPPEADRIGPTLARTAAVAEEAGFASFNLMDHFFQMDAYGLSPDEPMLEGYTTLGFVAGVTESITLGLLVTGVVYRHPGILAKTVATLDVLSQGRARLGLGASWYDREQAALGVPVVALAERFERLEEAVQVCRQMFSDDDGPWEGTHYQLAETLCVPQPVGGVPILIGGGGERKTLKLVARHGDACNLFGTDMESVAHKLDVLASHCEDEGRNCDEIEKTVLATRPALADVDAFLATLEGYADLGITEVMVMLDRHPVEFAERMGDEVLPAAATIG